MDRSTTLRRWLLIALLVAYIPGTPGLGIDTRVTDSQLLPVIYTVAWLLPAIALVASWRWAAAARWLALASGVVALVLAVLDLAGVLVGPPPVGMIVIDAILAIVGAAVAWTNRPA